MNDITKIEISYLGHNCKSCEYCKGQFDDKYLCKKPSSSDYLNECFVSKKELDDLDFCIDYCQDKQKIDRIKKRDFKFNEIWCHF